MGLLDILFPKRCVQCRKIGDYVCSNCFAQLSFDVKHICLVCNGWSMNEYTHPRCIGRYIIDGTFCGFVYNRIMKRLIYVFKYRPYVSDLRKFLTELLHEELIQQESFIQVFQKYTPVFIPIPLSPKRLKKRGYNQAKILAQELANVFQAKMIDCLERTLDTKPQFGLKREERKANMIGAFSIKKSEIRNTKLETNPSAFLIDDLLTTGTTLLEAANVLKRNGFKKVWGICLARDQ